MIRRAVGTTPPATKSSGDLVVDKAAPATSHVDTGLAPGTTYSYALFAHDEVPNHAAAATGQGTTGAASHRRLGAVAPRRRAPRLVAG